MADIASLAIQIDVNGAQRARQALRGLQDGSIRATRANQQLVQSNQQITRTARPTSNGLRQISLQLSQVAQQGAATGNFVQALAIQLPDLALAFGPVGIAIGAVVGGLASFALSSSSAGEEAKSLRERLFDLRDSVDELTDAQIRQVRVEFFAENRQRLAQIQEYREKIQGLRSEIRAFNNAGADGTQVRAGLANPDEARAEIDRLTAEIDTLIQTSDLSRQQLDELISGVDSSGDSAKDATEKVRDLNTELQFQVEYYGESERAIALAKIQQMAKNGADEEAIRIATRLTNALYDKKDAEEAALAAEERRRQIARSMTVSTGDDPLLQRIEAEKRGQEILLEQQRNYATARASLDQQILSSAAQTAGNLAGVVGDLAGRQSDAYKAAFVAQQAFAIASAIVNTQLAAAAALAPPPIGLGPVAGAPLAATIEGLGAANVAIIAAQTVAGLAGSEQSYLGGGYTGTGSRSGGVDGKGGFPAILHPNETVIDHELAGSKTSNNQSTQVTQVFQLSDNARREAKQQILESAPIIQKMARQAVLQAIQQGGDMARAVGRRS